MTVQTYDLEGKRLFVAGHRGMVGSAVIRRLESEPVGELITATSTELDLRRQVETETFMQESDPDVVILAAAKVGGIHANRSAQGEFLYDNLMIAANVVEAARRTGVDRIVVLGSSCIYPRDAAQPIAEASLLTGALEPTNEGYAVAKIAALELGKMYHRQYGMNVVSLMPTNLYGPNDNYDLETSHVMAALIRRTIEADQSGAKSMQIWGTGSPRREFLHVDDVADATIFALKNIASRSHLNVGMGKDISIAELAALIAEIVGWGGTHEFDTSMPDGTPRKLLDVTEMSTAGWTASIGLREGIERTVSEYRSASSTSARY